MTSLRKNVSNQKISVFAFNSSSGAAVTGDAENITAKISLDFGASADLDDDNPTELDDTNHPGLYYFSLTQAETNADVIIITSVSSTSGVELDSIEIRTSDIPSDVWNSATSDHSVSGSFGEKVSGLSSSVSGSVNFTLNVDDGTNPLDGVSVEISTDNGKANVVQGPKHTDSLGNVTFDLDPGTYYQWNQKAGYNFTNPTTITVTD